MLCIHIYISILTGGTSSVENHTKKIENDLMIAKNMKSKLGRFMVTVAVYSLPIARHTRMLAVILLQCCFSFTREKGEEILGFSLVMDGHYDIYE